MARLSEDFVLRRLGEAGLRVPAFRVAATPDEAEAAARDLGSPVVVKALVPAGKRGRAGAVRFAESPAAARDATAVLLGTVVGGFTCRRVLVAKRLPIRDELFLAFTFDSEHRAPVCVFSRHGGVDVEDRAGRGAAGPLTRPFHAGHGLREFEARRIASLGGIGGDRLPSLPQVMVRAARVFRDLDAFLLELNPVAVLEDGGVACPAALTEVDDQALFRHPEFAGQLGEEEGNGVRPDTPLERAMRALNARFPNVGAIRFTEFPDGDLGFMMMSGGAGLTTLGHLLRLGGRPATTFDITPGPFEEKMYHAVKLILGRPGLRGLIAGGNVKNFARVDIQVRAIIRALGESGIDPRTFPVVLRFAGPGVEEAREMARAVPGLEWYEDETSLDQAVERIVARTRAGAA